MAELLSNGLNEKVMICCRVRLNYATTHHDPPRPTTIHHDPPPAKICPPPPTTTHHQPKYIHHHPPPAKIYPPPPTITHHQPKYIHHHPPPAKIYPPPSTTTHHHLPPNKKWTTTQQKPKYIHILVLLTLFLQFLFLQNAIFPWWKFCVIKVWSARFSNSKFLLHFTLFKIFWSLYFKSLST